MTWQRRLPSARTELCRRWDRFRSTRLRRPGGRPSEAPHRSWRPLILFQIWYALIAGAIISVGRRLAARSSGTGHGQRGDYELRPGGIFSFGAGAPFLALLAGILGRLFLAERCGVLLLAAAHPSAGIDATDALGRSLRRRPPDLAGLVVFPRLCRRAGAMPAVAALWPGWLLGSGHQLLPLSSAARVAAGGRLRGGVALGYAAIALVLGFACCSPCTWFCFTGNRRG